MAILGLVLALAIGVSLGLLGGGGSTLTVPVLHYAFGIAMHDAIATSLIIVAATSMAALIPHARAGVVQWRVGITFGLASMVTAFLGGRLGAQLPGMVLLVAFATVMLIVGAVMVVRARLPMGPHRGPLVPSRMVGVGLGVGALTGVLGAGGGFLIVPALTIFARLSIRDAIGTSLFVIALNSLAGLAGTVSHATIDPQIAGAVSAIAILGSIAGARLGRRIGTEHLQRAFGWFVITLAVAMLAHEII